MTNKRLDDTFYEWIRATDTDQWIVIPSARELAWRNALVNAGLGKYAELHEGIWREGAEELVKRGRERE